MGREAVSVAPVEPADHDDAIRALLEEYLDWFEAASLSWLESLARRRGGEYETFFEDVDFDYRSVLDGEMDRVTAPDPETPVALAREGQDAVGCVYLAPVTETTAEVKRLYVRPSHRGRGLGRALVETLVDGAVDRSYGVLRLNTAPFMVRAQQLYADLGFEPTDPYETRIPELLHEDWTFMRLDLDNVSDYVTD